MASVTGHNEWRWAPMLVPVTVADLVCGVPLLILCALYRNVGCEMREVMMLHQVQVLENVTVELDLAELEDVETVDDATVPLKRMPHNSSASTFVVLIREEGSMSRGCAASVLKFTVKEVDATTGEVEEDGYVDEYSLEDIEVG